MGSAVGVPTNSCKDKMVLPKVMTYDNAADSVLVEKLHSKAITSTESKLSLLTVLLSPGCLAAFRLFLKDRLSSVEHEFYNTNLEYFHDEYRRSKGKSFVSDLELYSLLLLMNIGTTVVSVSGEWCAQHNALAAMFVEDTRYKHWRATEVANVLSAMNSFVTDHDSCYNNHKVFQRVDSSYDMLSLSSPSDKGANCSITQSQTHPSMLSPINSDTQVLKSHTPSYEALKSTSKRAVADIAQGSVWLVQFLSMMEDFPIACSLARVEGYGHGSQIAVPCNIWLLVHTTAQFGCSWESVLSLRSSTAVPQCCAGFAHST
jgi:hypothetical protein